MNATFSRWMSDRFNLLLVPRSFCGFPSIYAAYKWLENNACGDCSFIVNGNPYPHTFEK